jgi:hypothetical protein
MEEVRKRTNLLLRKRKVAQQGEPPLLIRGERIPGSIIENVWARHQGVPMREAHVEGGEMDLGGGEGKCGCSRSGSSGRSGRSGSSGHIGVSFGCVRVVSKNNVSHGH